MFREVFIVVARKNGKSLLASAIAKYEWQKDGYGARVFCIAPKFDQTAIIYDSIWNKFYMLLLLAFGQGEGCV